MDRRRGECPIQRLDALQADWYAYQQLGGLIKADIRVSGIHKHFHLLALHQDMLNSGHIHPKNEHTKPAGIWRKLETLYDLGILDEREDARQLENVKIPREFRGDDSESEKEGEGGKADDDADAYSEAANKIENEEFGLPGDDFAERKWIRRLPTERERRGESPPLLPDLNMAHEAPMRFTPSFSIEPSDVATPTSRKGRAKAGRPMAKATSTRRSTRQAESVADEDGEDEDVEVEESSEEEDRSEQSTPARRGARTAKGARGRADQKATTRSRARVK